MIDAIAIAISHGLLIVAFWRLLRRDDLDNEGAAPLRHQPTGFLPSEPRD